MLLMKKNGDNRYDYRHFLRLFTLIFADHKKTTRLVNSLHICAALFFLEQQTRRD